MALATMAFGLTFFGLLLSWIRLFGPEAFIALTLLETVLVVAVMVSGKVIASRMRPTSSLFIFPLAFLTAEYLRGRFPFGGFNWGGLGYSLHDVEWFLRIAAFTGVWGLTFLVAGVNVVLWKMGRNWPWLAPAAILLAGPVVFPIGKAGGPFMRVAIVQGNTEEDVLDPSADDFQVLQNHIGLTRQLPGDVSLVVWPESALDTDPFATPEFGLPMIEAIRRQDSYFLIGAYVEAGERQFLNQTLFFNPDGTLLGTYTKQHLVPFGEYIPYRSFFEGVFGSSVEELQLVSRDGIPGDASTVFNLPGGAAASVICYESTFPGLVRSFVREGAGLLVVSTNNSSFERTPASRQHVAFSQMRAAEHHTWVIHAALTGISAIVSPSGEIIEKSDLWVPATLLSTVRFADGETFYGRTGDWLPIGSLAILASLGVSMSIARRRSSAGELAEDDSEFRPLIVIPTYREAENIERIIDSVRTAVPGAHVLIVDDSSPDGTEALVKSKSQRDDRVHLVSRAKKTGLGRAYVDGFRWGLERDFNRFVEMDADFSHDPGDLPRLIATTATAGLAIGSRYVPGGRVDGWSRLRHALSQAGNIYARLTLGFDVRDSTSGFRCYRREALEAINLSHVSSQGYAFQIDMAYRVWRLGFPVVEIPIMFRERTLGGSKMSRAIVYEALLKVTAWATRDFVIGRRFRMPR